jgi:hypothetical protein
MHGYKPSAFTQRVLSLEERSSTEHGTSAHEVPSKGECQAAKLEQFQAAPVKCQHHEMLTELPAECAATEPA